MNDTGDKIRLIRKEKGLTLKQFGELFSPPASDSIVSRWERGESNPNNVRLKRIADLGGVTVKDLMGYDTPNTSEKIRRIRKELGYTIQEFGKLFNPPASKGLVCNWEKGRNLPNKSRLKKIAELGNTTVDELTNYHSKEMVNQLKHENEVLRATNLKLSQEIDELNRDIKEILEEM